MLGHRFGWTLLACVCALAIGCGDDGGGRPGDGGGPTDSGAGEDGSTPGDDGGTPDEDGGTPGEDGGTPDEDGGTPDDDGGTPDEDGGTPDEDGGTPDEDGGTPGGDAGPDAGMDAAAPDAGPDAGEEPDAGLGETVALEDFPRELARTYCDAFFDCYGGFFDLSDSDCVEDLTAAVEDDTLPRWEEAIAKETLTYDAEAAVSCLTDLRALGCPLFDQRWPSHCNDTFVGTVADGGDCEGSAECAGDQVCHYDLEEGSCPGSCEDRLAAGATCYATYQCESGTYCDIPELEPTGTCTEHAKPGETCGGSAPSCRADSVCLGEPGAATGTCFGLLDSLTEEEDASCDLTDGTLCEEGLSCTAQDAAATTYVCEAAVGSGETCNYAEPGQCPDGEYCAELTTDDATGGTCTALPTDGELCAYGRLCAPKHACVEGTCYERKRLDETCVSGADAECYSSYCDDGTCAPLPLCLLDAAG